MDHIERNIQSVAEYRFKLQMFWMPCICGSIAFIMFVMNIFTGQHELTFYTAVIVVCCAAAIITTRRNHVAFSKVIVYFCYLMLSFGFLRTGGIAGFSPIWIILLPQVMSLIYGGRASLKVNLCVGLLVVYMLWAPAQFSPVLYTYTDAFKMRFPIAYLCSLALGFAYSKVWEHTDKKLVSLQQTYSSELEREVAQKTQALKDMQRNIIFSFADLVESRDELTGQHVVKTVDYARHIVEQLREDGAYPELLTEEYCKKLCEFSALHDIGKIAIPDSILCKPGKLTREEFEVIKTHTTKGAELVQNTLQAIESEADVTLARNIALYHHERWDGTGYPEGLAGEDIPLCARIVAVADVFDALTSKRCYKDSYTLEHSFHLIECGRGTQFDPLVVDAFCNTRDVIETYFLKQVSGA